MPTLFTRPTTPHASSKNTLFFLAATSLFGAGCGDENTPPSTSSNNPPSTPATLTQGTVDKIDLLLVIDNSRGMGFKQELLSVAVNDLFLGFANPPCVDLWNALP